LARLVVAGTHAIRNGLLDRRQCAAPQPVVVVQVRIADPAGRAHAVTWRAVVAEGRPALRLRKGEQHRISFNIGERRLLQRGALVATSLLQVGEIGGHLGAIGITQNAGGVAADGRPGRIKHPVREGPHDGGVKQPQPLSRQGRIEFLDAVPLVPRRGGAETGSTSRLATAQSSRKGILPASVKVLRLPGHKAYARIARKIATQIGVDHVVTKFEMKVSIGHRSAQRRSALSS